MNIISANFKWVMLVSGVLTCTMIYAAIDPQAALQFSFGATIDGPIAEIVVRNWGALITLVGAMLIYGAYNPSSRPLILIVAGSSKLIFITLVLVYGRQYLARAGIAIVFDSVTILLFISYMISLRQNIASSPTLRSSGTAQKRVAP